MKAITFADLVQRLNLFMLAVGVLTVSAPASAGVVLSKQAAQNLRSMVARQPRIAGSMIVIDDMIFASSPMSIQGFTPGNRWPSAAIPIAFDGSVDATKRAQFMNACALWAQAGISCVARTTQANYVIVSEHSGNQCNNQNNVSCSRVGMVGGAQPLHVYSTHWTIPSVLAHELGHAIGLIHEHMRSDRGNWVQIFLQNAHPKSPPQFAVSGGRTLSAYDMKSIMHYDPCSFATNGDCYSNHAHRVIEAKHCRIKETPRPSSVPTAYDNFSIRTLYQLPGAVDPGPWMPPFQPVQIPCGPSCRKVGAVKYGRVNFNKFQYYIPPVPSNPMTIQRICQGLGQAVVAQGKRPSSRRLRARLVVTVQGDCGCPNTL